MNKLITLLALLICSSAWAGQLILGGATTSANEVAEFHMQQQPGVSTFNYGGATTGLIGWGSATDRQRNFVIWFNPDSITCPSSQITTAICSLWVTATTVGANAVIIADTCEEDYVVGTSTGSYQFHSSSWNNQGDGTGRGGTTIAAADSAWATAGALLGSGQASDTKTFTTATVDSIYYGWDVTNIVKALKDGAGYGILFYQQTYGASSSITVASSDHATTTIRPQLVINYTVPPNPAGWIASLVQMFSDDGGWRGSWRGAWRGRWR